MIDSIERLSYRQISDYVLVRAIGRGTHYTLYQAVDPRLGRMVVIKILHVTTGRPLPDTEAEQAFVLEARLHREAQALQALSHPNVPAIYEMGEQDGHPFLVMEYLYGHPLRQHLDQRSLPMEEALHILEQVASAVDAAHLQGILHRDIRASNIMLLHDGRVKLVEFGLARQPGDTTVTLMGTLVGEPAYMAPEQLRNQAATPASDLWALGVLLYEMLAGKPPFEGANFQLVAHQVIMGQPAPVPNVSAAVQTVLNQALEKDPEKRYPSAQDLVKAFRKAASGHSLPALAPRTSHARTAPQAFAWAGAILLILAVSVLIGLSLGHHSPILSPTASAATLSPPIAGQVPLSIVPTQTQPVSADAAQGARHLPVPPTLPAEALATAEQPAGSRPHGTADMLQRTAAAGRAPAQSAAAEDSGQNPSPSVSPASPPAAAAKPSAAGQQVAVPEHRPFPLK